MSIGAWLGEAMASGTSGGIGQAICHKLAEAGALVIAHHGGGRQKADEIVVCSARLMPTPPPPAVKGINILVNNAGVSGGGKREAPSRSKPWMRRRQVAPILADHRSVRVPTVLQRR